MNCLEKQFNEQHSVKILTYAKISKLQYLTYTRKIKYFANYK